MKIILKMKIHTSDNEIVLNLSKVYDSVSIPAIGMKIKDNIFAQAKEILDIEIDYSKEECFVLLEPKLETKERLGGHIQEVAALHNWIIN